MGDKEKKHPGYTPVEYARGTYTPATYGAATYEPAKYEPAAYTPATYDRVDYAPSTYTSASNGRSTAVKDALLGKINRKEATVGVVGLGYVGMPLAVTFADAGYRVIGVDTDALVVEAAAAGGARSSEVGDERLKQLLEGGGLSISTDYATLAAADCISICVPTPLTKSKEPDISYITAALDRVVPLLKEGMLVVLESTTYPGTTEELIGERIVRERGLAVGEAVFVAFSPERMDPGNREWTTKTTPKVLGGVTPACTEVARALYTVAIDKIHPVSSAREAETVKLLENTFRAVNIGLVNEFTRMCDRLDIDVWRVIEAASTKPFGYMPFYPGPGIGGHCIPLDPLYLSWKAKAVDFTNRFIELATDINGNMPRFVVDKLADLLNGQERSVKGAKVLLLGMAYKKNVSDVRESPGLEIYRLLARKGAHIAFSDPHVSVVETDPGEWLEGISLTPETTASFDAAVLVTDHDGFDYRGIAESARAVLDCRNGFGGRGFNGPHIVKL